MMIISVSIKRLTNNYCFTDKYSAKIWKYLDEMYGYYNSRKNDGYQCKYLNPGNISSVLPTKGIWLQQGPYS